MEIEQVNFYDGQNKISDVIKALDELWAKYGDVEVLSQTDGCMVGNLYISVEEYDDEDEPVIYMN